MVQAGEVAAKAGGDRAKIREALVAGKWDGILGTVDFADWGGFTNQNQLVMPVIQYQGGKAETVYPKVVWGGTFYWRVFRWLVSHLRIQDLSLNGRRLGAMVGDVGLNGQVMAMGGYRPGAFDGPLALIKTRGLSRWHGMLFRSWRSLAGARLSEYLVPGMHGSVFEPANVGALASAIGQVVRAELAGQAHRHLKSLGLDVGLM